MSLVEALLSEARRQKSSLRWVAGRRRSRRLGDSVLYTAFRSRGFLIRRFSRTVRDLLEAAGIALVASSMIAVSSFQFWVLNLVLMSVVEGIYQALKGSIIDFRSLDRKAVAFATAAIVIILQGLVAQVVFASAQHFAVIRTIYLIRAFSFVVEAVLGAYYFDISAKLRVYLPPQWTVGFTLASVAAVVIGLQLAGEYALYAIVLSHAAIRIADQAAGFFRTRQAERKYRALQKPMLQEMKLDSGHVALKTFSGNDLKRIAVWSSLFVTPAVLSLSLRRMGHAGGGVLMWTLLGLLIRINERPFRAFSVDLVDGILKHQWFLVRNGLRAAIRSSLALSLALLAVFVAIVATVYTAYLPFIALLLVVSTLQRILVNASGSVGLEPRLFVSAVVPRAAAVFLYAALPTERLGEALVYFIGLELLSVVVGALRFRETELASRLESEFADRAIALTPEPKYLPAHFLTAWCSLRGVLADKGLPDIHLSLTLAEPYRSNERMESLLERIKTQVRPGDLMMAVAPQQVILWMPGADRAASAVVIRRLLLAFPLDVEKISLLDAAAVSALVGAGAPASASDALPPVLLTRLVGLESARVDSARVLEYLSRRSRDFAPEGRWWMRDRGGEWADVEGNRTDSRRAELFFNVEQSAASQIFLHQAVRKIDLESLEQAYALKPCGALIAVFSLPGALASDIVGRRLAELNRSLLGAILTAPTATALELSPIRFRVVTRLAEAICRRHGIVFTTAQTRTPGGQSPAAGELTFFRRTRRHWIERWSLRLLVAFSLGAGVRVRAAVLPTPMGGELTCLSERPDRPLTFVTPRGSFSVVDIEFNASPFVRPYLACARWLSKLRYASWYDSERMQAVPLLVPEGAIAEARLVGEFRTDLYRACLAESYCNVRFPFKWLAPWTTLTHWRRSENPILAGPSCRDPGPGPVRAERAIPDLREHALRGLAELEVSFAPIRTLGDAIVRAIERGSAPTVLFASTMNFSSRQLLRIGEALAAHPAVELVLLFDFNLVSLEEDWAEIAVRRLPPNLKLMPIFNTPTHGSFFHFKGLSGIGGGDRFFFSSANLKGGEAFQTFDIGFSARQPAAADSLTQLLLDRAQDACADLHRFQCSLESRYETASPLRWLAASQAQATCEFLGRDARVRAFAAQKHPEIFLSTQRWNALAAYRDLIRGATRTVRASTHLISDRQILEALEAAHARGIATELVLGYENSVARKAEMAQRFPLRLSLATLKTQVHTKAIVADERRLIWGTGNFTHNGLSESAEFFFYTEEPALIRAYADFLDDFRRAEERPLGAAGAPPMPAPAPEPGRPACFLWEPASSVFRKEPALAQAVQPTRWENFYVASDPRVKSCLLRTANRYVCTKNQLIQCLKNYAEY